MPTICRKCYVHPEIIASYLGRTLTRETLESVECEPCDGLSELPPEEAVVLAFLQKRLAEQATSRH